MGQGVRRSTAQHGSHLIAATHRHIAAGTGNGLGQAQRVAIGQRNRGMARRRPAAPVGCGDADGRICARHCNDVLAHALQRQAAAYRLQHRQLAGIANQPVGRLECSLIHGSGGRNALPGLAVAPHVLEQREQARGAHMQGAAIEIRSCLRLIILDLRYFFI
ncbi:hypothetical protein SDC9_134191 [bioreactor metagenome]|uniref:Uncharacterized protein n=1 Tax=bioreactor metagenome TaxID=1076179 RepID=A0A645DDI0_9ZZZZ